MTLCISGPPYLMVCSLQRVNIDVCEDNYTLLNANLGSMVDLHIYCQLHVLYIKFHKK